MKQVKKRLRSEHMILESARQLIAEKGCEKTTFAELMKATGLSKGAIYHYVTGKDDLMAKLLQNLTLEKNEQLFYQLSAGEKTLLNPADVLARQLKAIEDPDKIIGKIFVYLVSRSEHQTAKDALDEFYESLFQFAVLWIRSGQQNGTIPRNTDPYKAAELFMLILDGFRLRTRLYHSDFFLGSTDLEGVIKRLFGHETALFPFE
ncbi:TetR/AcrR family transcriptional regulator [Metabacillus sp. 84]|uniref:TetR/AcrR family transcriptional regulator n=1 Tax=Metabacillus sp. 84 TaxID=3404705 RepID=UPI003CFB6069